MLRACRLQASWGFNPAPAYALVSAAANGERCKGEASVLIGAHVEVSVGGPSAGLQRMLRDIIQPIQHLE
jgi:hypothetical protein